MCRVNRNGVEEDIFANPVPHDILHPDQLGRFQRTGIRTARIDEIDGDNFVLDQVVKEADRFALGRGQRHKKFSCKLREHYGVPDQDPESPWYLPGLMWILEKVEKLK
jgi:hypothetical protein